MIDRRGPCASRGAPGFRVSLVALVSLAGPMTALAQDPGPTEAIYRPTEPEPSPERDDGAGVGWLPGSFLVAPLRAAPREVKLRAGFASVDRDVRDYAGRNVEAQVYLGLRLPVIRLREPAGGGPGVDLGLELGTHSRFAMEEREKDLIVADYRVGIPFSLSWPRIDLRLGLAHESSHYGDDYIRRFDPEVLQISRETFELLLGWRPLAGLRLYGGGDYNFGRGAEFLETGDLNDPYEELKTVEEWRLRFGAEYDPSWTGRPRTAPFAAVNFETTDRTERLSVNAVAGAAVRFRTVRLLFDAEYHEGPSPLGQFQYVDESYWGLNFTIELWTGRAG